MSVSEEVQTTTYSLLHISCVTVNLENYGLWGKSFFHFSKANKFIYDNPSDLFEEGPVTTLLWFLKLQMFYIPKLRCDT